MERELMFSLNPFLLYRAFNLVLTLERHLQIEAVEKWRHIFLALNAYIVPDLIYNGRSLQKTCSLKKCAFMCCKPSSKQQCKCD